MILRRKRRTREKLICSGKVLEDEPANPEILILPRGGNKLEGRDLPRRCGKDRRGFPATPGAALSQGIDLFARCVPPLAFAKFAIMLLGRRDQT
jgi:hypothetical protein